MPISDMKYDTLNVKKFDVHIPFTERINMNYNTTNIFRTIQNVSLV